MQESVGRPGFILFSLFTIFFVCNIELGSSKELTCADKIYESPNIVAASPDMRAPAIPLQASAENALVRGGVEHQSGPVNILFLLDASYSMKDKLAGQKKMNAAKQVLEHALSRIPANVNLGLRVFGQEFSGVPELDCRQTALLVPLGQGNRRSIIEKVRRVEPFGMTPLEYALRHAAEADLKHCPGTKTIILITDGAETCGGDPCGYIRTLPQRGIKLKVDIVGLDLKRDPNARAQLNCIAESSGGKYYDANTYADLIESVSKSVSKAISGKVIMPSKQGATGTETSPDIVPLEPEK